MFVFLAAPRPASATQSCPADVGGDGTVDVDDLFAVISAWGPNPGDPADVNGDAVVDIDDLFQIIGAWGPCPAAGPQSAELAGVAMAQYPFFTHSLSFNVGSTVRIAADPFLLPQMNGVSAKVYIVADRSAAQWASNAALVDARPSGPQTILFDGDDVVSNTFSLDSSAALSANAGTGLGVGYDVVIDRNENGVLDAGDVIDGADGAGFYVVHDITTAGPLATTSADYSGGSFLGQRTFWPANIASMGQLPLVIISHGNGMQYTWYDYLQSHLASYGYIVMSHQNNTMPGSEAASVTTLTNTDYILANQAAIAGGVLNGHIDSHRIVWIGHSRGGEGVVRAYDKLFDGTVSYPTFGTSDIKLVCSIAPTDFLGTTDTNPHAVPYHLLYGSADGDVCGCPNSDIADSFNVFERAGGMRSSTYVHGADHNDFNCCGTNDFSGPAGSAIGSAEAQQVSKAVFLAVIKSTLDGNLAARDYLWRQWEGLHPLGVDADTVVVNDFRIAPNHTTDFVVDDFQVQPSVSVSSSGGAVAFDVLDFVEGLANDNNTTYTWQTNDPMDGLVRGANTDIGRCAVFDFNAPDVPAFLEYQIIPARADWSHSAVLTFRAAQGTRHPDTIAILDDLTFNVVLRDGNGVTSKINIGAYSGGIEEPYQRTGFGTGAGWQDEFEVIRIPLQDFVSDGSGLDLSNIAALRFEFGGPGATSRCRVALDDIVVKAAN